MRSLADTLRRIKGFRSVPEVPTRSSPRLRPLNRFGLNPGGLRAWCHVPANITPAPALVVALHGCTQSASVYDHCSGWSGLGEERGFAVLFPEQVRSNNTNLCFNWFNPVDVRRDSGEAMSIRQMIDHMVDRYCLDRNRIFITGLSAGGAMANAMLAAYPEVFTAGAILAGLPYMSASTVPQAFDRMRGYGLPSGLALQAKLRSASDHEGSWPAISVWHGGGDDTVAPANARAIVDQWRGVHCVQSRPTISQQRGDHTLQIWQDATGRDVIELHTLAAMGHGAPIDIAKGYEKDGPFFLDIGVSSTLEAARAWGLGDTKPGEFSFTRMLGPWRAGRKPL
ncbi:PHB depolymerase family esterase [Ensifer sp. IC3342]|nr:PHB depolymerase family esterase [Ensifer sp. BRP08]MCA1450034.1 PHB depolymerase family esterase [Ensifer sp. IC3342]